MKTATLIIALLYAVYAQLSNITDEITVLLNEHCSDIISPKCIIITNRILSSNTFLPSQTQYNNDIAKVVQYAAEQSAQHSIQSAFEYYRVCSWFSNPDCQFHCATILESHMFTSLSITPKMKALLPPSMHFLIEQDPFANINTISYREAMELLTSVSIMMLKQAAWQKHTPSMIALAYKYLKGDGTKENCIGSLNYYNYINQFIAAEEVNLLSVYTSKTKKSLPFNEVHSQYEGDKIHSFPVDKISDDNIELLDIHKSISHYEFALLHYLIFKQYDKAKEIVDSYHGQYKSTDSILDEVYKYLFGLYYYLNPKEQVKPLAE